MAKILVNIWSPLIDRLNDKCKEACLRRDSYLDVVLRREAQMLKEEVARNSDDARSHIAKHLGLLTRKQVNLLLGDETVSLVNDVCNQKNIPRDAFVNRVLFFLTADRAVVERIFTKVDWKWARDRINDDQPDEKYVLIYQSRLDAIGVVVNGDPFWIERECIRYNQEAEGGEGISTFHATMMPKDFLGELGQSALGFNCFLDDSQIEGHPAQKALSERGQQLLHELFGGPVPRIDVQSNQAASDTEDS